MKELFKSTLGKILMLVVQALIVLSLLQNYRNSGLRQEIRNNKDLYEELEKLNKDLEKQIDISEKEKQDIADKIESLRKSEIYFKTQYYATNKKLKEINNAYIMSNNDDKWHAFTGAVNQ